MILETRDIWHRLYPAVDILTRLFNPHLNARAGGAGRRKAHHGIAARKKSLVTWPTACAATG